MLPMIWEFPSEPFTERSNNMALINRFFTFLLIGVLSLVLNSCSVSYSFTGTNINYEEVQTFSVENFFNDSGGGPANMEQRFTESLKEFYQRNFLACSVKSLGFDFPCGVKLGGALGATQIQLYAFCLKCNRCPEDLLRWLAISSPSNPSKKLASISSLNIGITLVK